MSVYAPSPTEAIEHAQLTDEEVRALAKNTRVRGKVKNDIDFEVAKEREKLKAKERFYIGFGLNNEVVAQGSDLNKVKTATKKYAWQHKTGDLLVGEYSLEGKFIARHKVLTGVVPGTA